MRTRKGQKYPCATHKSGCREYPPDPAMHLSVQDETRIPASLFGVPFPSLGALTQRIDDVTGGAWTPRTVKRDYCTGLQDWRSREYLLRKDALPTAEVSVIRCSSCSSCRGTPGVSLEYSVDGATGECVLTTYHTRHNVSGDTLLNTHNKHCDFVRGGVHDYALRLHYVDMPQSLKGCSLLYSLSPTETLWAHEKKRVFHIVTRGVDCRPEDTDDWEKESFDAPPPPEGMEWETSGIRSLTRVWGKVYIEIPLKRPSPESRCHGSYGMYYRPVHPHSWVVWELSLDTLGWREVRQFPESASAMLSLDDNVQLLYMAKRDTKNQSGTLLYHMIYDVETDTWTDAAEVTCKGDNVCVVDNEIHMHSYGAWSSYTTASGWECMQGAGNRSHNWQPIQCRVGFGRYSLNMQDSPAFDTVSGERCRWKRSSGWYGSRPSAIHDSSFCVTNFNDTLFRIDLNAPGDQLYNPVSVLKLHCLSTALFDGLASVRH
ncbi:hypothetical protein KIPB_004651 [Kipferlia bialata]|uniref:Uncharacterized protein n=1 Tax=Kipferlia bialata TaxID=797122 RepID=A0A9K3CVD8_9EUKA|nr:hypothetical protein KIPB_004651 [Kipferlia bialata]|eukprot:g4651.t1